MANGTHFGVQENKWQIKDARSHLSQVIDHAVHEGAQTITVHGKPAAVVLSVQEFRKLAGSRPSLVQFFRESLLCGVELDLKRSKG